MKIGFILSGNYFSSLYTVTRDVAEHLESKGHTVDNIFVGEPGADLKNNDKFILIKGLTKSYFSSYQGVFFRLLKNILGKELYQFTLSRYFCQQLEPHLAEYDAIFVHGTNYRALHKLERKHHVVLHCCKYLSFLGKRKGVMKRVYQKLYQKVYGGKHLLTVSQSVADSLVNQMGVQPKSIEPIYNGFNFDALKARAEGSTENIPDKFIMAAGRPDRSKRFDILLRAYAKTKQTHPLVIFGSGRGMNELEKLAHSLGIEDKVIFWGYCKHLLPYFKKASAYVLSSDIEGLPTVIVESLSLGTPVVATDAAGVEEMLSGDLRRWVVPRGDVDALAAKIDAILENPPHVSSANLAFLDYRIVSKKFEMFSEHQCD